MGHRSRANATRRNDAGPEPSRREPGRGTVVAICALLAAATALVYAQTLDHGFVNYDDDHYVTANPHVAHGLDAEGVVWAFTRVYYHNWHPLTWISHMLDVEIHGLDPGGHHLTNVLLHASAAMLLFLALRALTVRTWRSAFVAALFAVHPLHVESVAWISERKDVLSGLFFALTLAAYARYARAPSGARYLLVVAAFALGLASKPTLVALPLLLLVLDAWPLGRLRAGTGEAAVRIGSLVLSRRALLEKVPLLALSLLSCAITIVAQGDAVQPLERLPLGPRLANAVVSLVVYLRQTLWPVGLSAFYPHPASRPPWEVPLAALLLLGLTATALALRRSRPYLLVGWLWYLLLLLPVIGIVQVGAQAHADRYTYLPQIGLCLLATWAAADAFGARRLGRAALAGAAAMLLAGSIALANAAAARWRSSEALWTQALASTTGNAVAHANLGVALLESGRVAEAIAQLQQALVVNPRHAEAHNNLGFVAFHLGRNDAAIAELEQALALDPGLVRAHLNLGNALLAAGRVDEAIGAYQRALALEPGYAEAHNNLGSAWLTRGQMREAIAEYEQALASAPEYGDALQNLAWTLASGPEAALRDGPRAVALAERARASAAGVDLQLLATLAAAYAEAGRFADAVRVAEQAIAAARSAGQQPFAQAVEVQLANYRAGRPLPAGPPAAAR